MAFYHPRCLDRDGGFFHFYKDDGEVYDKSTRSLVSSTRFVFNYAMAQQRLGRDEYIPYIEHGLKYIEERHKQGRGYAWVIKDGKPVDDTNYAYGLAFVLLANGLGLGSGLRQCQTVVNSTWALLQEYYWEPEFGLYKDEYNKDFTVAEAYRGQNANMHLCEAFLLCFESTKDQKYLDRAVTIAHTITVVQAQKADGLIWEHYNNDYSIAWDYQGDKRLKPFGCQVGHLTEWAKLLVILSRYKPLDWLVPRAEELFMLAVTTGWDNLNGGLVYGFRRDKSICDNDKYHWVQAESLAAAALLALKTGKAIYWHWYNKLWEYSWEHMIDHEYGAWYRVLTVDNKKYNDQKSPNGKTDYHGMGACYEVIRALEHYKN
eukprot:CAMPEP_0203756096 /NCGR_PEP_ID=MMETSP0098-20131031/9421_1 /ASSEMBLY_ACC=CAM_ASM_000208 /TAXON_ID=96639 /ORGANISM=" , Strain NY0313808BC1" /LENGTH=373 /DNA_ID=CAMNT_0050647815 /DNA_START=2236 /DNA_END=3357 /DNA_ORIENTATION=-